MLGKEFEQSLVTTLILLLDTVVLEVRSRSHPAVDLVVEALDVLGPSQGSIELLDVLFGLVAGREHDVGDGDGLGVLGVDHGRVDGGEDAEGVGELVGDEGGNLASPAELLALARHEHERSEFECA